MFPADVADADAAVVAAGVALLRGDLQGCDENLLRARELLPQAPGERTRETEFAASLVTVARAAAGGEAAGLPTAVQVEAGAPRLGLARPVDVATEAVLTYARGCALLVAGDLEPARQTLEATARQASDSGYLYLTGLARARLALTEALAGRLGEAEDTARAAAGAFPDVDGGRRR